MKISYDVIWYNLVERLADLHFLVNLVLNLCWSLSLASLSCLVLCEIHNCLNHTFRALCWDIVCFLKWSEIHLRNFFHYWENNWLVWVRYHILWDRYTLRNRRGRGFFLEDVHLRCSKRDLRFSDWTSCRWRLFDDRSHSSHVFCLFYFLQLACGQKPAYIGIAMISITGKQFIHAGNGHSLRFIVL